MIKDHLLTQTRPTTHIPSPLPALDIQDGEILALNFIALFLLCKDVHQASFIIIWPTFKLSGDLVREKARADIWDRLAVRAIDVLVYMVSSNMIG